MLAKMDLRFTRMLAALAIAAAFVACGSLPKAPLPSPEARATYESVTYKDPAKWLCLPGRPGDACAGDQTATSVLADGSRVAEPAPSAPAPSQSVDCFYVYPTVDLDPAAGNHDDFTDTRAMGTVAAVQAARFRDVCNVYAPLYRQMTIGTYLRLPTIHESYAAIAESDVEDAFLHYLAQWNRGRKIVLIGHSQGADMIIRLMQRLFDHDEAMRKKLLYAIPIGFRLYVRKGERAGGSFDNIPLCDREDDEGCVITYRSFYERRGASTFETPASGLEDACVSPATLLHNDGDRFSAAYFPLGSGIGSTLGKRYAGIDTPFLVLRDFYAGRCKRDGSGHQILAVTRDPAPGDVREDGLAIDSVRWRGPLGLHILDVQFAEGDLVQIIGRKSAASN